MNNNLYYYQKYGISNLFSNFNEAADVLIEYKDTIISNNNDNISSINIFYNEIYETQKFIDDNKKNDNNNNNNYKPRVIVIEGLDGSGKTSLANSLALAFDGKRMSTPGAIESLSNVRDIFDGCKENIITRAYYMVKNISFFFF